MTKTASEYGGALYSLAEECGKVERYLDDLRMIRSLLAENPDYLSLLSSRALAKEKRLELLDEAFSGRLEPYLLNFLKLLCENGTIGELPACIRKFELDYYKQNNLAEVSCVTAVPLTDDQKKRLQKRLEAASGKTVLLSCTVDAGVLGGVYLTMDGTEYDGTVRRRLDEIRKTLAQLTL